MIPELPPENLQEWQRLASPVAKDFQKEDAHKYEGQLVDRLRIHARLPPSITAALIEEQRARFGERRATLAGWHEMFPTFPIFLQCGLIRNVAASCPFSLTFTDFKHRPFVKGWVQAVKQRPDLADQLPVGFIFRWPRLGGVGAPTSGLVVHNRASNMDVPGVRLFWRGPEGEQLTVTPLQILLAEIDADSPGGRWSPDKDN